MKAFYNKLIETFNKPETKALYTDKNMPAISQVDFYAGQDQEPESFEYLQLPGLFFSWSINYENEPAVASLQFRLLFENLRSTSSFYINNDKALAFFDAAEITDQLLKSINIDELGALHLVSEGLETEPTVTDVYLLDYEAHYYGKCKSRIRTTEAGEIDDTTVMGNLKTRYGI